MTKIKIKGQNQNWMNSLARRSILKTLTLKSKTRKHKVQYWTISAELTQGTLNPGTPIARN